MSDTPLPPPPPGSDRPPTAMPDAPPTAQVSQSPQLPPPPPGAPEPPTGGPTTAPPTVAGPAAGSARGWKPVAAIAGSALGGALIAFLISWAVIGHDGSSDRVPISSGGRSAEAQSPGAGPSSQHQGRSSSGSASGSTSQGQNGSMPSARSGAS